MMLAEPASPPAQASRPRWRRSIGALLALAFLLTMATTTTAVVTTAQPAQALCAASNLEGVWHNIDSNTRAMARVDVTFTCNDVRFCDPNGNCTGPDIFHSMRPWGSCQPTNCDWGTRRATDMSDDWIRAIYNFGFKTSYVWLKTYQFSGITYLRVWVHNEFAPSDPRTDYTTDEWMLR
jgi:hypothetical protein